MPGAILAVDGAHIESGSVTERVHFEGLCIYICPSNGSISGSYLNCNT